MATGKKNFKKTMKSQITERLESTFADLSASLGKTKFRRNIRNAAKALAQNLKESKDNSTKPAKKTKKEQTIKPKKSPEEPKIKAAVN